MSKTNILIVAIVVLGVGYFIGTSSSSPSASASTMTASADGVAIWQFPDLRVLDPELFGTPQSPLNVDLLPLAMRATNEAGTAYTTTSKPVPFSDKVQETTGSITISVNDLTAKDGPNSKDTAEMEANFKGPNGEDFRVVLNKLISKGGEHQMFGGVGSNVLMHGSTGIGTPLVAEEFSYITLWGIGDLYRDGELVDEGRIIHMMVSEKTRDAEFNLGLGVASPDELEIHLMLPPKKPSPTGPVDSPVKTGVTLPNGAEQPFIHTNFYGNIVLTGNQFAK